MQLLREYNLYFKVKVINYILNSAKKYFFKKNQKRQLIWAVFSTMDRNDFLILTFKLQSKFFLWSCKVKRYYLREDLYELLLEIVEIWEAIKVEQKNTGCI